MPRYANTSGKSNVRSYEVGEEGLSITVAFGDGSRYEYTYDSVGAANLAQMFRLAEAGSGLNAFINKRVRKLYARKL